MSVFAQTEYTFTAYRNVVSNGYNFWVSTPDDYATKKSEMPTPIRPDNRPMMKVSALKTSETLCLEAPIARRIPISFVLSRTDT